jgi:hypothetical protein
LRHNIFWDVTSYILVDIYQDFERTVASIFRTALKNEAQCYLMQLHVVYSIFNNVLEEPAASIFYPEAGGSRFLSDFEKYPRETASHSRRQKSSRLQCLLAFGRMPPACIHGKCHKRPTYLLETEHEHCQSLI